MMVMMIVIFQFTIKLTKMTENTEKVSNINYFLNFTLVIGIQTRNEHVPVFFAENAFSFFF